jgi:anti-anti-sigma factor
MTRTLQSITPVLPPATVIRESRLGNVSVLKVEGPLHASLGAEVRRKVQALLQRGERTIVLSLARVRTLDAAGVGELVRVHNLVVAANGRLRIAHTTDNVRTLLDRLGLFDLLTSGHMPAE